MQLIRPLIFTLSLSEQLSTSRSLCRLIFPCVFSQLFPSFIVTMALFSPLHLNCIITVRNRRPHDCLSWLLHKKLDSSNQFRPRLVRQLPDPVARHPSVAMSILSHHQRLDRAKTSLPSPQCLSRTRTFLSHHQRLDRAKNVSSFSTTFESNANVPSFSSIFDSGKNISSLLGKNGLTIEITKLINV